MGMYSRANVHYQYGETLAESWTRTINDYWKVHALAKPVGRTEVVSNTQYGVPRQARTNPLYGHPDIVRVRRFGHKWSIVE